MYVEGRAKETAATRHSVPYGQMGGTGGGIAQKIYLPARAGSSYRNDYVRKRARRRRR